MKLECQTPGYHIVNWVHVIQLSGSFEIMLCKIFLVKSQKLKTEIK